MLASSSYDNSVKIWTVDDDNEYYCKQSLEDHSHIVWSICFSNDGKLLFSGSQDTSIKVYQRNEENEGKYEFVKSIGGSHSRAVYSLDFWNEDRLLVAGGGDDALSLHQVENNGDKIDIKLIEKIVIFFF